MRVAISLRLASEDWEQASAYVVEAERLGVDCLWSAEAWGHDAVTPLAFMAARTSRIRLGPGIAVPHTRHISVTASAIATPAPRGLPSAFCAGPSAQSSKSKIPDTVYPRSGWPGFAKLVQKQASAWPGCASE